MKPQLLVVRKQLVMATLNHDSKVIIRKARKTPRLWTPKSVAHLR